MELLIRTLSLSLPLSLSSFFTVLDTANRQPFAFEEEDPLYQQVTKSIGIFTCTLASKLWEINAYDLGHLVYGIML